MKRKGKNEYIFDDYFDVAMYLFLSAIYPSLSYFMGIEQIDTNNVMMCCNAMLTGMLFTATIFYDFYSRWKVYEGKRILTLLILFVGRILFAVLTIAIFCSLIYFLTFEKNMDVGNIKALLKVLGVVCLYPGIMSFMEIVERLITEFTRRLSRVRV